MVNSADPDQTPRSVASDLGLHCLIKLQEGLNKTIVSPFQDHFLNLHSEKIDPPVLSVL